MAPGSMTGLSPPILQYMAREPYNELLRKFLSAEDGDSNTVTKALEELESLFHSAIAEGELEEFLNSNATRTIEAIACQQVALTAAVLRWLPDDDVRELSDAICYAVDVHYLQVRVAVQFDLAGGDRARAQAAALRLVGNNAAPAVSVGWLLSLASEHGEDKDTMDLVNELMDYHVEELPISTKKLLSNEKNPLVSLEVARTALKNLRDLSEHLRELPEARELMMPVRMRLMYASLRRRRNRVVNAGSQRKSFFASLFKPQYFKYSTRAAVEIHHADRIEETTLTMAPISISMELPVSEAADPIAGNFRRQEFLQRGAL